MNTTIYLPMPEWQALAFLRNREEAFRRLVTPAGNHLPCEVVLMDDGLFGFRKRENAVATGKRVYPLGFAVVRIVIVDNVLSTKLTHQRQLSGLTDTTSGAELWRISRDGLQMLAERSPHGEMEILVDEIFSSSADDDSTARPGHRPQHRDHGLLEEGGLPIFGGDRSTVFGAGPLGFGC